MESEKDKLRKFFLVEIQQVETYIKAMKRDCEEEKYSRARHYTMEAANRVANMNGTLALLDKLKE